MSLPTAYQWEEDEHSVTISVPFRGKSLKRTDLVIFDTLVKISHPSYRLEIYLKNPVNDSLSRAAVKDDSLIIHLAKELPGLWGTLDFIGTKDECQERRRVSLLKLEERNLIRHQNAKLKKQEEHRSTVRSQMNLEQSERQLIEDVKALHTRKAEKDVYDTLSMLSCTKEVQPDPSKDVIKMNDRSASTAKTPCPSLRETSIVRVSFTPRFFKTPARESTVSSEENFLARYGPYLMNQKAYHSHSSTDEENPLHLKEKGDLFYKNKDYLSAINAYSPLLHYNDTIIHALTHRSYCYLQLGDIAHAIDDCKHLLEILEEGAVSTSIVHNLPNLKGKILLHLCYAYCQYSSMTNFDLALECIQKVKDLGQDNSATDGLKPRVEQLKKANYVKIEGDALYEKGDNATAIKKYVEALSIDSDFFTAGTNLTAATFAIGQYDDSVDYCNKVLETLSRGETMSEDCLYVPPPGGSIRRKIIECIRHRRAMALEALGGESKRHL